MIKRFTFGVESGLNAIRQFILLESAGAILLFLTSLLALVLQNSQWSDLYTSTLSLPVSIQFGDFILAKDLVHWINDGLMAIFFLLVGLEIKREFIDGELSSLSQIALPGIAALGGMLFPALIYLFFNSGTDGYLDGWAVPTATDIAFALGVLSLLGNRVPISLKIFLTALAIFDDLGAIVIIAIFYVSNLSIASLLSAAVVILILLLLNRRGVQSLVPYGLLGIILWVCVLKSGVHATLAGVVLAFMIPARNAQGDLQDAPLSRLEHVLHPWVAFLVLPFFGFANAGLDLSGITIEALLNPVSLGVFLGLFLGKQIGVFLFTLLAVKFRIAALPTGSNWWSLYGVALLTGMGFTMSLFITTLAFADPQVALYSRIGVLLGSAASTIAGVIVIVLNPANELASSKRS